MALRRSSIALFIVGLMLITAAAVIRYVVVPHMSKLPADTKEGALFEGALRQIDPTTFGLDAGTPITIDRSLKVDRVVGDTALVTCTVVTHLPSGDITDVRSFAVNRVDFTQAAPPDGVSVEDQRGGITLSFPMNPTTDDALVYDQVTRTAQPVTYTGTTTLAGREVYEFTGTATAPIVDPAVLGPVMAGIAALVPGGDGSTLPREIVRTLIPALSPDRAAAVEQALAAAPDPVPLTYTSVNMLDAAVDTHFGTPIRIAQNQTAVLNIASGGALVPLLDLSQVRAQTSDASIQKVADKVARGERQLKIAEFWVPLVSALVGVLLLVVAIVRRKPGRGGDNHLGASGSSADNLDPQVTRARG